MALFPELSRRFTERMNRGSEILSLNLKAENFQWSSEQAWYRRNGFERIASLLSGGPTWAGETISREAALCHSVVWACNQVISGTIGYIPASLMQRLPDGTVRVAEEHPIHEAIHNQPNEEMSAQALRERMTSHCLLEGNAYARIIRRSGSSKEAVELRLLTPESVEVTRESGRLTYKCEGAKYTVGNSVPHDILHIRGMGWNDLKGYSVIHQARQTLGTAISADRNVAKFYANGGRLPYLLEMENSLNDEDFQKFRADWERVYSEPHRAPILENGTKYKPIGSTMAEAQQVEFRQGMVSEICRWFSLSPHMVGDLSRATNNNIEQLALEFVKFTLSNWISRWEQDFRRCVLTAEERKKGYYLHHNIDALVRGDLPTRMSAYATALQNGFMNVDEVRRLDDRNALPDGAGQAYRFQLNMQTTPGTGTPTVVEQGVINRGKTAATATAQ